MRGSLLAIGVCLAVVACGRVPPAATPGKASTIPTKELPKDWVLENIVDAMPPRSDDGPTHILAWKVIEDDRPVRVEYCLAIKQLRKPTENQEQWVLASLAHNPREGKEWNFVTIWITPDSEAKNPPFIMHVKKYRERPTNAEINAFMDEFGWAFRADEGWTLIDGGICEAWEKVVGEKTNRSFQR